MLKQITTYIANNMDYTIGTNLFAGTRPDTAPDKCVTVLETGGGSPVFDLPDYLDKMVQVLARGTSYFQGQELAQGVYNLLHGKAGISLWNIKSSLQSGEVVSSSATIDPNLGKLVHQMQIEEEVTLKAGIEYYMLIKINNVWEHRQVLNDAETTDSISTNTFSELPQEGDNYVLFVKSEDIFWANTIEAIMSPQSIGQDDKGRFEFSTNFVFRIQNQQ